MANLGLPNNNISNAVDVRSELDLRIGIFVLFVLIFFKLISDI